VWPGRIVTQIVPFEAFYVAEDYHQEYYRLNGQEPYCQIVIAPKMAKLRRQYRDSKSKLSSFHRADYPEDCWSLLPVLRARYNVALEIFSVQRISTIECRFS
jgi:hypothetical protein